MDLGHSYCGCPVHGRTQYRSVVVVWSFGGALCRRDDFAAEVIGEAAVAPKLLEGMSRSSCNVG